MKPSFSTTANIPQEASCCYAWLIQSLNHGCILVGLLDKSLYMLMLNYFWHKKFGSITNKYLQINTLYLWYTLLVIAKKLKTWKPWRNTLRLLTWLWASMQNCNWKLSHSSVHVSLLNQNLLFLWCWSHLSPPSFLSAYQAVSWCWGLLWLCLQEWFRFSAAGLFMGWICGICWFHSWGTG